VTVTIGGANHVPVAVDDSFTTRSGRVTPLDVTANDDVADGVKEVRFAGPDGSPTDATELATAAGGLARRNAAKISYTAPGGTFTGSDSFTYVVIDNDGEVSKPATVRATVVRNQPPQVKDGWVAVPQNRTAVGSIAKLGWDPEKDAITFAVRSAPAGQLTLKPDGTFLYQAPAGVEVDAFSFVANDGNSDSNEGHLSIQVTQAQGGPSSSTGSASSGSGSWSSSSSSYSPSSSGSSPSSASSSGSSPPSGGSSSSPGTGSNSRKRSTSATTQTTAKSSTTATTGKSPAQTTGKSNKASSSNNRGKPTTASTTSKSKALLPVLPLAAAPLLRRRRPRGRR
jgi:hypothetical protein